MSEEQRHRDQWWYQVWGNAGMPRLHQEYVGDRGFAAIDRRDDKLKPAVDACSAFAEAYPRGRGLILSGDVGAGKTLLAVATAHQIAARLYNSIRDWWCPQDHFPRIRFATMPGLLSEFRNSFGRSGPGQPTFADIDSEHRYSDLLILDDVGAEKVTDWSCDVLYQFVDYRYRESRPTIFTSNLPLAQLADRLSDRIVDRVYEMCLGNVVDIRLDSFRGQQ